MAILYPWWPPAWYCLNSPALYGDSYLGHRGLVPISQNPWKIPCFFSILRDRSPQKKAGFLNVIFEMWNRMFHIKNDTFWHGSLHFCGTIPETNIALESLGLEEEFPFGKASSQVGYVNSLEGTLSKMSCWEKLCGPWFFCRPRKDPPLKRPKKGQKRTEFSSTSCDWLSTVFFWNNCN